MLKEKDKLRLVCLRLYGLLMKKVGQYIAQKRTPFAETTTEQLDELSRTNARGSFLCTREEISAMLRQPRKTMTGLSGSTPDVERGCIVNVSSVAALAAMAQSGSYVPTNWSRYGMTKSAAVDHAQDGIRVNSLLVGYTVTEGFLAHPDGTPELAQALIDMNPSKRLAMPDEAADAIVFLCSPLARYVNGTGLVLDGGRSAAC
jgi:NAD(P)-dependent dehydrogenase (short-subunit alcohol dehydrogenase family)